MQRAADSSRGSERVDEDGRRGGGETVARPGCRGSGRRRREGEPTGRRPRSPRAGTRGQGVDHTRAQSEGAHPQPGRRGVGRRGGGAAEGSGPRPSRPPRGCENRPRAGVGAGIKFPETRVARGPAAGSRQCPPRVASEPSPARSAPRPGPCPGPQPPTGSAPRRLALRPPARLPASAGCPPRVPLLLPSARARGGPRARSLRPAALSRGGGRAARGGGGASAREELCGGGRGSRRGTRGAAGVARAHCSVRRRAKPRGAPPTLTGCRSGRASPGVS